MDQKTDSLEEYMEKYRSTHTGAEADDHFHSLTVKPARREYTYHKYGIPAAVHPGDIVRYEKHNKTSGKTKTDTFVALQVKMYGEGHVIYGNGAQSRKIKYCHPIQAGSLQCIGLEKTTTYLEDVKKKDA